LAGALVGALAGALVGALAAGFFASGFFASGFFASGFFALGFLPWAARSAALALARAAAFSACSAAMSIFIVFLKDDVELVATSACSRTS
jgi:hypothetical protein